MNFSVVFQVTAAMLIVEARNPRKTLIVEEIVMGEIAVEQTVADVTKCSCRKPTGLLSWFPCHRRLDRTIHIRGKAMPLCARCSAILVGYWFTPIAVGLSMTAPIWLCLAICLPMVIDGYTQLWNWRNSNNFLRVMTGLAFGIGQSLFISTIIMYVLQWTGAN